MKFSITDHTVLLILAQFDSTESENAAAIHSPQPLFHLSADAKYEFYSQQNIMKGIVKCN